MKKLIYLLACLIVPVCMHAQNGVYQTLQDFKDRKLTKTCDAIHFEQVMGKNFIIFINGKNRERVALSDVNFWGVKKELTEYRLIKAQLRAISARGDIWLYSGSNDVILADKNGDTTYYKKDDSYPWASKGLDGELVLLHSQKEFFNFINPADVEPLKTELKKRHVLPYMESMADYCNSRHPSYVSNGCKGYNKAASH